VQCEYSHVADPCERCKKLGLLCTGAEKTWGPKRADTEALSKWREKAPTASDANAARNAFVVGSNSIPKRNSIVRSADVSNTERCAIVPSITEVDALTLREITRLEDLYGQFSTAERAGLGESILIVRKISWEKEKPSGPVRTMFPWPQFPMSSKPFRYASLAFACGKRGIVDDIEILEYRSKAFHYAQEAINKRSLVEAAMAIYGILLTEHAANDGFQEVTRHFKGFCAVLQHLKAEELSARECKLLQRTFWGALKALRIAGWASLDPGSPISSEQLDTQIGISTSLQHTSLDFLCSVNYESVTGIDYEYTERMDALEHYLLIYLDTYIGLLTFRAPDTNIPGYNSEIESIEIAILRIMDDLTLHIPQLPGAARLLGWASNFALKVEVITELPCYRILKFDGIRGALLYAWVKVLQCLINRSATGTGQCMAVTEARALYRLTSMLLPKEADFTKWLPISRSLFWSGLILTKDVDTAGTVSCCHKPNSFS
jgi:hypothetical protein